MIGRLCCRSTRVLAVRGSRSQRAKDFAAVHQSVEQLFFLLAMLVCNKWDGIEAMGDPAADAALREFLPGKLPSRDFGSAVFEKNVTDGIRAE